MKRKISILLILCMVIAMLSALSVNVYADEITTQDITQDEVTDTEEESGFQQEQTSNVASEDAIEESMNTEGMVRKPDVIPTTDESPDGFALVSQNEYLEFHLNDRTGFFALRYKKTGAIWYSNSLDWRDDKIAQTTMREELPSQFIVQYLNSKYNTISIDSTKAKIVSESKGEERILTYVFTGANRNFSIPISYMLDGDHLKIEVKFDDIEENSDARVTQITLLPYMGAGGLLDDGYILLPDGSGSLMEYNKIYKNMDYYNGYIYSRDLTASSNSVSYVDLTERINMPVYGIRRNGNAMLAVITQSAATARLRAVVSRRYNSYNSISPVIIVRDTQTKRNATTSTSGNDVYYSDQKPENFMMRVYPLDSNKSDYVGMAEKYRKYLIEEQGLTKLDENNNVANALNLNLFCAIEQPKHFLGVPYMGTQPLTKFTSVMRIIDELKAESVDKLTITLSGWESGGLDSSVTTSFKPDSSVGSVSDAKKLVSKAEQENVTLMFDANVQNFYGSSSDVKKFTHTAYSLASTPITIFEFSLSLNRAVYGGNFHQLIHPSYMLPFAEKFMNSASKVNITNYSFMNSGLDPYAAYNQKDLLTRDRSTEKQREMFAAINERAEGIVSTRGGNSFVFGNVDNIVDAPIYSSNLIMAQKQVPFYQIVLRGYINLATPAMNLSSEFTELELLCAETAMSLFYELMDSDSTEFHNTHYKDYYACGYSDYFEDMVETYARLKKVYDAVGVSEITNSQELQPGLKCTSFSNGAKVYVNYSEGDITVSGIKVAARSYSVVGGE